MIRDRNELSAAVRRYHGLGSAAETGPDRRPHGCSALYARYSREVHELRAPGRQVEHERCPGAAKRGEKTVVYLGNVGIWPTMGVQKYTDPIARVKTNRGKPGARKAPLIAGRKPCPQCYRTVWGCTVFCPPSVLATRQFCWNCTHCLLDTAFGPAPKTTIEGLHPLALLARLESPPRHPRVAHSIGCCQTRILSGHTTGTGRLGTDSRCEPVLPVTPLTIFMHGRGSSVTVCAELVMSFGMDGPLEAREFSTIDFFTGWSPFYPVPRNLQFSRLSVFLPRSFMRWINQICP